MFSSCCNYHCKELLSEIPHIEKKVFKLDDASLFYIIYELKHTLDENDIRKINLMEHLSINWKSTTYVEDHNGDRWYMQRNTQELDILQEFMKKWDVVCSKTNNDRFLVRFKSKYAYDEFKSFALELSKPDYVFEGDVLDLVRIAQETDDGIVELKPLDGFAVTNTLAKILGLRNVKTDMDYHILS